MEVVRVFSRDRIEGKHECIAVVSDRRRNEVIESEWALPGTHISAVADAVENYSRHQDEGLGRQRSCHQEVEVTIRRLVL